MEDLKKHNITLPADPEKARAQHALMCRTMEEAGWKLYRVKELAGHPNSVFTMDTALSTPYGYIQLRMGLESRDGEEEWMAKNLDKIGEKRLAIIEKPGKVEGGDVILDRDVAFVGQSGRTNQAGVEQIERILAGLNYDVRVAQIPQPYLHIGGAMSLVEKRTVLCCRGVFPPGFFHDFEVIEIEKDNFVTANVIALGEKTVIAEYRNSGAISALQNNGFQVHTLDLSEFLKGTGGPSCLVLPLKGGE